MECYGTIYFKVDSSDSPLVGLVKERADSEYDLSVDDQEYGHGFMSMWFIGGGSTGDGIKGLMRELNVAGSKFVKGSVSGDEEPWCVLFSVDDGKVSAYEFGDGIYEYLSECDEEDISRSEELKEAHEKGPKEFFESKLNGWKEGIEALNTDHVTTVVEMIIDASEDMI